MAVVLELQKQSNIRKQNKKTKVSFQLQAFEKSEACNYFGKKKHLYQKKKHSIVNSR